MNSIQISNYNLSHRDWACIWNRIVASDLHIMKFKTPGATSETTLEVVDRIDICCVRKQGTAIVETIWNSDRSRNIV